MKAETSDRAIEGSVARELQWDPKVGAAHVSVSAKNGAVVLTGNVSSYAERLAAVRAAERVYGVRAVADEIEVRLGDAVETSDGQIAETISRQLAASAVVPATVKVEVKDGRVTLRGTVESPHQHDAAERPIEYLRGVYSVRNLIAVKAQGKPQADEIERLVHEAIGRMADLDARSIGVAVRNGTVNLHGHVHSLAERRIAERVAAAASGVRKVTNELAVTP
jgi:osmotically-inducible protein OsmY